MNLVRTQHINDEQKYSSLYGSPQWVIPEANNKTVKRPANIASIIRAVLLLYIILNIKNPTLYEYHPF